MKETNNLLVTKKEEKYANSLKKIELTPFTEPVVQIGNYFLLWNAKSKGFLVTDTDDKNPNYNDAFAVTTNPLMNFGSPRSLFCIEKYATKNESNVVNYGEKICLVTHPDIFQQKLYLTSSLVSSNSYSRFSRNQEVLVTSEKGFSTCWVIEHPDSTMRYTMEGKPVPLNEPFVLRHSSTARLLASDLIDYYNDYGHEYEVSCNNYVSNNKFQALYAEKEGKLKIDTQMKIENDQNVWMIFDQI